MSYLYIFSDKLYPTWWWPQQHRPKHVVGKLYAADNIVVLWLLYPYRIIIFGSLNSFYRLVFVRDKHAFCKTAYELGAFKYYVDEYILQSVESVIVWNVLTNLRNSRLLSVFPLMLHQDRKKRV